jgi:hypothetical protein
MLTLAIPGLILITVTQYFGCTTDSVESASGCYKVRLISRYCSPPSYSVLVHFDKPNSFTTTEYDQDGKPSRYIAAISNFPEELFKKDSAVYIKFHYDETKDKEFHQYPCTANMGPAKYLMLDEISSESCNSVSKPK